MGSNRVPASPLIAGTYCDILQLHAHHILYAYKMFHVKRDIKSKCIYDMEKKIYIVQCNSLIVKKKEQVMFFGKFKIFVWIRFSFAFYD